MAEEKFFDYIISRLEPQLLDYVEIQKSRRSTVWFEEHAVRGQNGHDISYRPRQRTKDRVMTAQAAPCCHLGWVELQIRIRDFQKIWEFHILDNMQYQCILVIDCMKDSRLTLDFDKKSLVIPDDQIKSLPIVKKPVEIDLSNTKLGERRKEE
ncbi:hypothetical protein TNCV_2848981 [Trichonephila clavipes]|nr:hypothetical protein TNCV_2848981 [Trichonephila clavipes]